jgi:hypothetical protein
LIRQNSKGSHCLPRSSNPFPSSLLLLGHLFFSPRGFLTSLAHIPMLVKYTNHSFVSKDNKVQYKDNIYMSTNDQLPTQHKCIECFFYARVQRCSSMQNSQISCSCETYSLVGNTPETSKCYIIKPSNGKVKVKKIS